jgi:polyhydroxyalkanoate synthesis repressor PhaR
MVKKDEQFIVVDAKTNEDITRFTLVQIILDHETKGYELMPEDFIKMMIKFYDHPMNKIMQDYISQAVKSFNLSMMNNHAINFSKDFEKLTKENLGYFSNMFFGDTRPKK